MTPLSIIRRVIGLPERDRLMSYITDAWVDFDREVQGVGSPTAITEPWARSAYLLLLQAENHVATWNIEQGWATALSAQRATLSNLHNKERIRRAAIALRRESHKITGWRAKAIEDLICDTKGDLIDFKTDADFMRVIEAMALRDEFSQNTWFKIVLRRRHLFSLFQILWMGIALVLALSWFGALPGFLQNTSQLGIVVLFGVLGAGVSVAQGLVSQDVSDRIPVQQMGALVVWTRPGIGAAAALAVFAILHANGTLKLFAFPTTEPAIIALFSFIAGYSERFIVGALERITQSAMKNKS